jgi:hypothetical protein
MIELRRSRIFLPERELPLPLFDCHNLCIDVLEFVGYYLLHVYMRHSKAGLSAQSANICPPLLLTRGAGEAC